MDPTIPRTGSLKPLMDVGQDRLAGFSARTVHGMADGMLGAFGNGEAGSKQRGKR